MKLNNEIETARNQIWLRRKYWWWVVLIVGAGVLRLWNWQERTQWGVEQSLTAWQIKSVLVDHQITLIGQHFFSLQDGALYRTPFYNWLMAGVFWLGGFSLKTWELFYALVASGSLVLVMKTAEKVGGLETSALAGVLYITSFIVIKSEMYLWAAAGMVVLSSWANWWLLNRDSNKWRNNLGLGLGVGFGFALHFVVVLMIGSIMCFWWWKERNGFSKKVIVFVVGLLIMLTPLLVFNLRHNFVMKDGLVNMLSGKAIDEGRATWQQRRDISLGTTGCLINKLVTGDCRTGGWWGLVAAAGVLVWLGKIKKGDKLISLIAIELVLVGVGLFFAGRVDYSSETYVTFLLPGLVVVSALGLNELKEKVGVVCVFLLLSVVVWMNLESLSKNRRLQSFGDKKRLAEYVLSTHPEETAKVKFWDQDVLAYDFVFWWQMQEMGLDYGQVSLVERWNTGDPDMYVYLKEKPEKVDGKLVEFGYNKLLVVK